MKTLLASGDSITLTATAALTGGTGVLIGQIFGVPESDAAIGQIYTLRVRGIITMAKTSALQIDIGDAVYWDDTNKVAFKTTTGKEIGWAVSASANPSPTVEVLLIPTVRTGVAA